MVNEFQQQIYNAFLKASRKGQPFQYRKNFENISSSIEYYLIKLEMFFKQFPHINLNDYFQSPYEVLDKDGYYDLKFYNTLKAKSCYSIYIKDKRLNNDITLEEIKNSLNFVNNFCVKNNIKFKDYIVYKNKNYVFLKHLKENKIHIFILFGFPMFEKIINQIDNETLHFLFGDLFDNLNKLRTNFYNSQYKELIRKAIEKLS